MNIQIFGTKKNFDSKKAERYFKERGIKYQFIDMKEKGLSKGEFQSVCQAIGGYDKLIDTINHNDYEADEFSVGNFRIDTLAFDEETKSFKIIEYKNVKNNSLVDQGYTYLKLLLERKADFVLKYNEKTNKSLRISDIDWSQSRIIFVSPIYTAYQLNATDFKNIPVDLIKVTRYEEDIVDIEFIKKTSNIKVEEMNLITTQEKVNNEIKVYTEEDHLNNVSKEIKELYENLKNKILELDDIDLDIKKVYIAFKGKTNICDVEIFKNKLKVNLNVKKGNLNDPLKIAEDIANKGHWGNGDYRVEIFNEEDIDNVIPLIKQSLKINKK